MHHCLWDGGLKGPLPSLEQVHAYCLEQMASFREDHLRPENPTPYKVSVSSTLYEFMHELWSREAPIGEIR
ncbi:MAG: hypothetical protein ACRD2M_10190 [Terriglobales bacterium]